MCVVYGIARERARVFERGSRSPIIFGVCVRVCACVCCMVRQRGMAVVFFLLPHAHLNACTRALLRSIASVPIRRRRRRRWRRRRRQTRRPQTCQCFHPSDRRGQHHQSKPTERASDRATDRRASKLLKVLNIKQFMRYCTGFAFARVWSMRRPRIDIVWSRGRAASAQQLTTCCAIQGPPPPPRPWCTFSVVL